MEEIWKDVPGYEGLYQVSNLGRLKSLPKIWITGNGGINKHNGKILKPAKLSSGYLAASFWKNKVRKTVKVHQLVAMAFLGHQPNGLKLVVDHINDDKLDNRLDNLQIVTQRYNARKTQFNYSSQYKGVSWSKEKNKWQSRIHINKKSKFLGDYKNEYDAHLAYQNALQNLEQ